MSLVTVFQPLCGTPELNHRATHLQHTSCNAFVVEAEHFFDEVHFLPLGRRNTPRRSELLSTYDRAAMFFRFFFGAMMCFALDNRWRERVHAQAYLYSIIYLVDLVGRLIRTFLPGIQCRW